MREGDALRASLARRPWPARPVRPPFGKSRGDWRGRELGESRRSRRGTWARRRPTAGSRRGPAARHLHPPAARRPRRTLSWARAGRPSAAAAVSSAGRCQSRAAAAARRPPRRPRPPPTCVGHVVGGACRCRPPRRRPGQGGGGGGGKRSVVVMQCCPLVILRPFTGCRSYRHVQGVVCTLADGVRGGRRRSEVVRVVRRLASLPQLFGRGVAEAEGVSVVPAHALGGGGGVGGG